MDFIEIPIKRMSLEEIISVLGNIENIKSLDSISEINIEQNQAGYLDEHHPGWQSVMAKHFGVHPKIGLPSSSIAASIS